MATDNAARFVNSERGFVRYSCADSPGCLRRRNAKKQASESGLIQRTTSWKFVRACRVAVIAVIDPATILIQKKNLVWSVRREASLFISNSSCNEVLTSALCVSGRRSTEVTEARIIPRGFTVGEKSPGVPPLQRTCQVPRHPLQVVSGLDTKNARMGHPKFLYCSSKSWATRPIPASIDDCMESCIGVTPTG